MGVVEWIGVVAYLGVCGWLGGATRRPPGATVLPPSRTTDPLRGRAHVDGMSRVSARLTRIGPRVYVNDRGEVRRLP
jgi:hypothetical protein